MWLSTIPVGRVKPEHREKLTLFQREVCQVLKAHFLGESSIVLATPAPTQIQESVTKEEIEALLERAVARVFDNLNKRLAVIQEDLANVKAYQRVTSDNVSLVHALQHQFGDKVDLLAEDLTSQYERCAKKKKSQRA